MKNYSIANHDLILTVSELGASIIELSTVDSKFPLLRPVELSADFNASQSAMFPLVPFANRIKGNCFIWEKQKLHWPKHALDAFFFLHGNGWIQNWEIIKQSINQLTFEVNSVINDICHYQATINYQLLDKELLIELSVTNKSKTRFPFGLGLHPFFTVLPNTKIQFNAAGLWLEDSKHLPTEFITPIPDTFSCNEQRTIPNIWINNGYTNWSGTATLQHDNGINITLTSDCPILQVFKFANNEVSNQQHNFICLEPQSHAVNDHNNPNYGLLKILEPEQSTAIWMKIGIELPLIA
ncbi:aldose 1-epimerase [Providencia burhodogranariea]|uniref:Aldose 1-epimerase n=1 Tax=Providencia burhodogranariea DSM 19968 TaxID=1141662 RepID=K8W608_9GAMM|nr:hypothetical protein OOA_15562 [Providencia burhodogranariea DSM 19968]